MLLSDDMVLFKHLVKSKIAPPACNPLSCVKMKEKNKMHIFQIKFRNNPSYRNQKFSDMFMFEVDQTQIKCNLKNRRSEICGTEICLYTVLKCMQSE